ncbi:MAG: biopolymer transporter ExbD [Candidatus Cloacimonetes bacterium]|nr:biopolymer transporter ExbD [Candidatus Cloacimonadota bacterium]MBS3768224.1 biopolymer transporter ExbD [Candidatus Cloacimonadota bacterium]
MNLNKEKKVRKKAKIPTASMADVAFILLFFFLVTTKFDTKKGLGLVLPPYAESGGKKVKLKEENVTKIKVNARGEVAVDDKLTPIGQLESMVRSRIQKNPKMVFVLEADRRCQYNMMVRALDKLLLAGAQTVSLSTR